MAIPSARYGTTGTQLLGSPKSVQCGTPPTATITTTPAGLSVNVAGTPNPMSCNPSCTVPAGISITVGSPQLGAAGTEYVFTGWSDPAGNPLTINAGATVTANFSTYYQFTGIVNPSGGGSILFGNANSQQIIAPPYSSSLPSACLPGGWCPAGTTFWVTGQASSGYGFINLSNGILQQDVIMYTPVTVTANFSSNVINVTTTSNLTLVKGGSMTAHYYGSGEYGNGSGSTSSGSLSNGSCSSITGYILAQIGNVNVIPGNISFDITFLDGFAQTPTGPEEVTCTCLYDGCVVNVGPINVTPPTLSLRVGGDPITLTPPQVTPIYITLNGPTSTVTLSVSPSGSASLDRTSLTIAANQTATVNLTPLAASQAIDDVQISASIPEVPAATANTTILGLTPARQSMTTLSGTASPPGGTFSNYAGYLSGNSSQLPQVALANGVNAQTNPTSVVLSNPTNACSGSPCPGAESQIELT